MSAISDIITGRGCLSQPDESIEYEFDTRGCECCNELAGKTLGNDVANFDHWLNITVTTEPTEWRLCSECSYAFTYGRDEPNDGYDYDKYY
jgi:hypothetical protein